MNHFAFHLVGLDQKLCQNPIMESVGRAAPEGGGVLIQNCPIQKKISQITFNKVIAKQLSKIQIYKFYKPLVACENVY